MAGNRSTVRFPTRGPSAGGMVFDIHIDRVSYDRVLRRLMAVAEWDRLMPERYRGLLNATTEGA